MQCPCNTCSRNNQCPYHPFIECPDWLEWAQEMNRLQEEEEEDD